MRSATAPGTEVAFGLLVLTAFAGDAVTTRRRRNRPRVFSAGDRSTGSHRLLNREHLKRPTILRALGGKAVVLGRFVPIVRTFVPFVAGAAQMTRPTFVFYNVTGALTWVGLCLGAGFLFGNVPIVKENFSLVTIGIVFVSILPVVVEFLKRSKVKGQRSK